MIFFDQLKKMSFIYIGAAENIHLEPPARHVPYLKTLKTMRKRGNKSAVISRLNDEMIGHEEMLQECMKELHANRNMHRWSVAN